MCVIFFFIINIITSINIGVICARTLSNDCVESSEMSVGECKSKLVCCGDSIAYDNLLRYTAAEFELGSQVYYRLMMACKYPKLPCTYTNIESFLLYLLHRDMHSYSYMDSTTHELLRIILNAGVCAKDPRAANDLYQYYTYIEPDSLAAMENIILSYALSNDKLQYSADYIKEHTNLKAKEWSMQQKIEKKLREPRCMPPQDTISPLNKLRYQVRCNGDTTSYARLIRLCQDDANPFVLNECLFEALLMYNRYDYLPAREHIVKILNSFYSEDETVDSLYLQIMDLYESK